MRISNQVGHDQPTPSPSPTRVGPMDLVGEGDNSEEINPCDETSNIADQDEAQAALQPAISAAASHLTSTQTPAAEKAAALERLPGGYFGKATVEDDVGDGDSDGDGGRMSSPEPSPRPGNEAGNATMMNQRDSQVYSSRPSRPFPHHDQLPDELPMPSPWTVGPKSSVVDEDSSRTQPTRSLLGSAFGPTRQRRSRSAGQEAFKKLQKALPSFGGHASFLPSLPTSFLSNFTGDHKQPSSNSSKPGASGRLRSATLMQQSTTGGSHPARQQLDAPERPDKQASSVSDATGAKGLLSASRLRPPMLRRVTSDESMLYHSLSRQSSLGDDNKFHDVREMVNVRFMAIRDSLPDVPNFKMPSLARLHAASRMPSMSFNGLFSSSADDNNGSSSSSSNNNNRNSTSNSNSNGTSNFSRQVPDARQEMHVPSNTGVPKTSTATSAIDCVLEKLTGDLVVLGGYRGSVLRSAEPPHQQLWAPVKLGFNMRKANLEVGLEDEDEEAMEQRIVPSGMLKHVGPVDISKKLFKKLRSSPNARNGTLRIWDFGYDWRLSPALSSKRLREFLAGLPSNRPGTPPESRGALVIAHSLGGLITRHAVNLEPELFSGVLYAGVPQRCINILGPFRNGDAVLFNEKLLTATVNFSIRTSFLLLPDDGFCFIDKETGETYPVDFFNADDWARWRLSPCVAPLLPPHSREKQPNSPPSLSSLFPNSLLKNKKPMDVDVRSNAVAASAETCPHHEVAPLPSPPQSPSSPSFVSGTMTTDQERYMRYLRRTLAATSKFRSELAHIQEHESANVYPPHAVLYGKTIPTVYAAQVAGREAIAHADAYDDLVFRPGDGVVLAREAMLPRGYALAHSGRVSTERGHLTMLGDLPAVAKALKALLRGREKGIGVGKRDRKLEQSEPRSE